MIFFKIPGPPLSKMNDIFYPFLSNDETVMHGSPTPGKSQMAIGFLRNAGMISRACGNPFIYRGG